MRSMVECSRELVLVAPAVLVALVVPVEPVALVVPVELVEPVAAEQPVAEEESSAPSQERSAVSPVRQATSCDQRLVLYLLSETSSVVSGIWLRRRTTRCSAQAVTVWVPTFQKD